MELGWRRAESLDAWLARDPIGHLIGQLAHSNIWYRSGYRQLPQRRIRRFGPHGNTAARGGATVRGRVRFNGPQAAAQP